MRLLHGERVPTRRRGLIIDGECGECGDILGVRLGVLYAADGGLCSVKVAMLRSVRGVEQSMAELGLPGSSSDLRLPRGNPAAGPDDPATGDAGVVCAESGSLERLLTSDPPVRGWITSQAPLPARSRSSGRGGTGILKPAGSARGEGIVFKIQAEV